jgi:hypothetical protein
MALAAYCPALLAVVATMCIVAVLFMLLQHSSSEGSTCVLAKHMHVCCMHAPRLPPQALTCVR